MAIAIQLPLLADPRKPDICRHRHGGNAESEKANERIEPLKQTLCERIYAAFVARGPKGFTTQELSDALNIGYTTASARMSELKRPDGVPSRFSTKPLRIVDSGIRRDTLSGSTAAVMVADIFGGEQ